MVKKERSQRKQQGGRLEEGKMLLMAEGRSGEVSNYHRGGVRIFSEILRG